MPHREAPEEAKVPLSWVHIQGTPLVPPSYRAVADVSPASMGAPLCFQDKAGHTGLRLHLLTRL